MTLSIIDQNDQPLVILSQDESGISVIGGDSTYVQKLGLNQFSSLKEIADFINSQDEEYQAVFDPDSANEENLDGEDNATFDDRIAPALEILKALLEKVQERRNAETTQAASDPSQNNLAETLNTTDTEIIGDQPQFIYVALSGDFL